MPAPFIAAARDTVRARVLLPLSWLLTCALMLAALRGLSSQMPLSAAVWSIMALNFVIAFFKLRLCQRAPVHWGYRVLVSAVIGVTAPGVAMAAIMLAAALFLGREWPSV